MQTLAQGTYIGQHRRQYKIPGVTFTRCYFPHAFHSDWHRHEHSHLTFCLKGQSIEQRKKRDILCSPGLLLFYPSDLLHRNTGYVSHSESFSIEFENEWCHALDIHRLENSAQQVIDNPIIKTGIIKVIEEIHAPDAETNLSLEASILSIIGFLKDVSPSSNRPPWIKSLIEMLHDDPDTRWTLTSLAAALHVHPVTLSKYFPRYFNTTLGEYIRKIKITRSLPDLARKSIPLKEIAGRHGFTDHAHFTRVFKQHTGFTPSAYRAMIAR